MGQLTINNQTVITNNPVSTLNLSVVSGSNVGIIGIVGPPGPPGPPGPASTGAGGVSQLNGLTGSVYLTGAGGIIIFSNGQTIFASGTVDSSLSGVLISYINGVGVNLSGQLEATGQSLYQLIINQSGQADQNFATKTELYNTGSASIQFTQSVSGAISDNLTITGQTLRNLTIGGDVNLSGTIAQTGQQSWNAANNNAINLSGNLALTGRSLYNLITGSSGQAGTNFATIANLALTGSNLYNLSTGLSGALVTQIGQTGQQAWNAANNNSINLSGNLTLTGQALFNRDASISGGLEARLTASGNALYVLVTGLSGQNNTDYATKAQLLSTGQSLYNLITGGSGQANSNYATIANLALTGSNLYNLSTGLSGALVTQIGQTGQQSWNAANNNGINLSGNLTLTGQSLFNRDAAISGGLEVRITATGNSAVAHANGIGISLSGNLTQTGVILGGQINSLSGFVINTSGALQQQISSGNGTQVRVTGSTTLLIANFTGLGGTLVFTSGGQVFISGGGSATAGVTSINGLSNSVSILGTGSVSVTTAGQSIFVSGDQTISGYVLSVSGGLETRISSTGATLIGYINSVGNNLSGNLATTGNSLFNLITGMSGQSVNDYATKTQLTTTGQTLDNKINSLSGFVGNVSGGLETRIFATGAAAIIYTNSVGNNLSGNLTLTGVALISRENIISGTLATGLSQTGATLVSLINGKEPVIAAGTMAQYWRGDKTWQNLVQNAVTGLSTGDAPNFVYVNSVLGTASGQYGPQSISWIYPGANYGISAAGGRLELITTTQSPIAVSTQGTLRWLFQDANGHFYPWTDMVTDIGLDGTNRVRYAFIGSGIKTPAIINLSQNGFIKTINGSGTLTVDTGIYEPSGNLTLTGQVLQSRIDSLSGFTVSIVSGGLENRIAQTGSAAIAFSNGIGVNISGNLTSTGNSLYRLITGMSGQGVTDYATKTQLTTTGQTLDNKVNSLSGFVVGVSGALQQQISAGNGTQVRVSGSSTLTIADFTGIGGLLVFTSGGQVFISGGSAAAGGVTSLNGLSSAVTIAGTGSVGVTSVGQIIYVSGDQTISGYVLGISGGLETRIFATGAAAIIYANSIGNNLSGNLATTGNNLYTLLTGMSGQGVTDYATKTQLTLTGQTLDSRITSLSGFTTGASGSLDAKIILTGNSAVAHANGIGIIISGNLTQTGITLNTRDLLTSGFFATGLFQTGSTNIVYSNSIGTNLSGNLTLTGNSLFSIITGMSGQGITDYATKTQLTTTGQTLDNKINSLSGFVGNVSGGLEARIFQTGAAAIVYSNSVGNNVSGSLTITGQTLQGRIDSLSGFTINVVSGGLENRITLTGNSAVNHANGIGINLSGNLTTTGQTLNNRINSLSGFTLLMSGALQNQIAGGGTQVRVSGSSTLSIADFTGIGGVAVVYSGSQVFISGSSSGPGGGVPSVNSITSAVIITGTGNFTTQTIGNTIYISGSVLTNDQQVLFDKSGITTGSDLIKWDYNTGTLEIGNPQLNYPDNPLSLGGSGAYLQTNIRNRSTSNNASSDFVATTDIGSDISGYIDLGINNSLYNQSAYDITSGNDAYLYANGGNLAIGTQTTGKEVDFFTAGTRSFNLRASIIDSGIGLPTTGIIAFGNNETGTIISVSDIRLGLGRLSGIGLAGRPAFTYTSTGWGTTAFQSAFYDNTFKVFSPNAAATQSLWGDTAANVGTLLLVTSEVLGDYTQITPAAGLSAGLSATTASIYRGSVVGLNGFFFTSKFLLNQNWASGLATSVYGAPSGCRIFVGLTDQAVATQVGLNEPIGNMVGLNYLWASGGSVGTGQYMQNWAIRTRNNTATTTGTLPMSFQTGYYRFSMYCPPFPNNTAVSYELYDLIRNSGVQGVVTGTLPVGSTAMRPMTALGFVSGIKTIGCRVLYVEKPS